MRIGIVSRWGAACGISLHAELIAMPLRGLGHEVRVYAPTIESASRDWHHVVIESDPPWVRRVYIEADELCYPDCGGFVRPGDWLENDIVVVEGYSRLPWRSLRPYLYEAKRHGARLALVVHYFFPREVEPLLEDPRLWDVVFVFDERFEAMVKSVADVYTVVLPYPFLTLEPRMSLSKPAGCPLLLFTFGRQPKREYIDYLVAVKRIAGRLPVCYLVARSLDDIEYPAPWLIVVKRRLSVEEVYAFLRASTVHLIPKWDHPGVVVSSTVAQTLYAGVPVVVPDTRYFETIPSLEEGGPLVKYKLGNVADLVEKLSYILEDEGVRRELGLRARLYAWERRAALIARRMLEYLVE